VPSPLGSVSHGNLFSAIDSAQDTTSEMNMEKSEDAEKGNNSNDTGEKNALAHDSGNSSDDEGEVIPKVIDNFYFTDENQEPISFTVLPIDWGGDENKDGPKKQVFLEGTADGGLQKIYKQAIAWKLNLQEQKPVVSVKIKEGAWIQLQKPRKSFEEIIRSVLVVAHFLHFARRNSEASEKAHWDHLRKVFSMADVTPTDNDLLEYFSLIEGMHQRDQKLKKSDVLKNFLDMRSKKRKPADEDVEIIPKAKRSKFLITDEESDEDLGEDGLDDSDEEADDLFDSVCAICDNGGELLCCEGPCMRSFHPNRESGEDSNCKSLGLTKAQVRDIQNFYCLNCKHKQHQCFICGKLGSSDKSTGAEVFSCISATCGRFYHPQCVSRIIAPEDAAEDLEKKIANGLQFTCPIHKCFICKQTENKEDEDMQFAICRRCPRAYHRKCLPKSIQFDDTDDEPQRAWDDLIPNRILIYCRKHKIDPDLATPKRNHIVFPEVASIDKHVKRNHAFSPESVAAKSIGKRVRESPEPKKEKILPKPSVKKEKSTLSARETAPLKVRGHSDLSKKVTKEKDTSSSVKKEDKFSTLELRKSLSQKESKTKDLDFAKSKTVKVLSSSQPEVKKRPTVLPSFTDNDVESSVMAIVERATARINLNDVCAKHQVPSTHRSFSMRNLDKTITQGKVEGSVEAVKSALRKLEEGGSIDDAKAVCEPDVLQQLYRWKNKLKVYLAPFIHGMRYTSFGRHFTKVDKLQEVVERLHWYVQNGDTIVDFCCGANDFSRLMKAKLEQSGKQCFFRNFDIIQPKNDFEFEKRDWLTVCKDELPTGTRLIMGLNPPFGVKAALANKFINKALEFKPKLVILIVPKETQRLDEKMGGNKYDLIWEDPDLLRGQSFFIPGSVDTDDNILSQWNLVAPPLSLWSRPDWTAPHKAIAIQQGHNGKGALEKNMVTAQSDVLETKPLNGEGNAFQTVEGKANLEKHSEKDQQDSGFGTKTVNLYGVDYKENEKESKLESLSSVQRVDELQWKDGSSLKIKEEHKESPYNRHSADKMNHEDNSFSHRNYEVQKEKDSDVYDHANDRPAKLLEQNHARRQDKGGHDDESGRKKNQKEMSPSRERTDRVDNEKYEKGRYEKGRHETDRRDKDRSKKERPDKGRFEKERPATSPPSKRMELRKDKDSDHFQDQGSLPINSPESFGRVYDQGLSNREDLARGLQIGSSDLGLEFVRGYQGVPPSNVDEGYGMGYRRIPGGGEDGLGRGIHRGVSEEYGIGLQHGRSGNVEEEYAAGERSRGIHRNFPGNLESEYSVSPADLQVLPSGSRVYSRQGQHDFDSERPRLSQDGRGSEWLMGDTPQRGRYYLDQGSHVNNIYSRNSDLVPDMPRSLLLGQQHEDPQVHPRLPYHSDAYERTGLTSSAMQRYAPRLDQQMNYTRSNLHQLEQAPRNSIYGAGQVLGSQNFPFDSRDFAPGPQNPYPHQSSSGWIDD